MKAYVICFILTIIFTYLAERSFKNEYKINGIFFSICAIFVPTFICGVRMIGVGRDITIYVLPALEKAVSFDFSKYLNSYIASQTETGYMIFVYIISLFSSNLNVLLFFIQLIPATAVFVFAYYYRKEIPMWFVMTTYLLTWYLRSYTMMRQSMAVGLILLSIITFEKKKNLKTIILFILAFLFHKSTIIAIGLYGLIWICDTKKIKNRDKIIIYIFLFLIICIALYTYVPILNFLTYDLKLLPERFVRYLDSEFTNDELQVSVTETAFRLIFIILGSIYILLQRKKSNIDNNFIKFFLFFIVALGPYIISFKIVNAERMNYYYYYPALLYMIPALVKIFKNDKYNKTLSSIILITILFVFWFYKYPIKKNCETYPYKTEIIKFLN